LETAEIFSQRKTKWWKRRAAPLIVALVVAGWHVPGHSDPDNPIRSRMFSGPADQAPDAEANSGRTQKKSTPSIRDPGPDFADFPNSAEVVPPGVYYMEIAPTSQWSNRPDSLQSGLELLFRTGIVPDLELRLSGSAITIIDSDEPGQDTVGSGPFGIGFKYHALDGALQWFRPAVGIEFQAVLPVASSNELNPDVVLPSGSLNLDHTLPANFSFHWNLGFQTSLDDDQDSFLQASFQWSIANDVTRDLQLYVTGAKSYPATPSGGGGILLVGAGFLWVVNESIASYGLLATDFATGPGFAGALRQVGEKLGGFSQIGVSFAF
jgi:hypothetical protein